MATIAAQGIRLHHGPVQSRGRFTVLCVIHSKASLYGGFVRARRALNSQTQQSLAAAEEALAQSQTADIHLAVRLTSCEANATSLVALQVTNAKRQVASAA